MKKTICFILIILAIFIVACNNPKTDTKVNPLLGAWEITYSKYVFPDSTLEKTKFDNPSVKILTKKHFAFGRQEGENKITGGGGEYTYDGDNYTENIKYHILSSVVGQTAKYKSTLKGDLWTISGVLKSGALSVELTETWKRILE